MTHFHAEFLAMDRQVGKDRWLRTVEEVAKPHSRSITARRGKCFIASQVDVLGMFDWAPTLQARIKRLPFTCLKTLELVMPSSLGESFFNHLPPAATLTYTHLSVGHGLRWLVIETNIIKVCHCEWMWQCRINVSSICCRLCLRQDWRLWN